MHYIRPWKNYWWGVFPCPIDGANLGFSWAMYFKKRSYYYRRGWTAFCVWKITSLIFPYRLILPTHHCTCQDCGLSKRVIVLTGAQFFPRLNCSCESDRILPCVYGVVREIHLIKACLSLMDFPCPNSEANSRFFRCSFPSIIVTVTAVDVYLQLLGK